MKNVLVLIANPARPVLSDAIVATAAEALTRAGATVGTPDWLAPGIACDLPFDGSASPPALPDVDAVVLASQGRRKKLLVADMESTMIHNEMLDELADFLGLREKIAGITARAMNGEIDFAGALEERVGLLKGLATLLAEHGRIVNLVSSPEIYLHEWASFSTRDYPENAQARTGDMVRIIITDIPDARPVEDIVWSDEAYRDTYTRAGLEVLATLRPLGRDDEPVRWVNETRIAPWTIHVLGRLR